MKHILTVCILSLFLSSSYALAKEHGKGHGAGGVSEDKMSEQAAEKRKAWAGTKEKKEKDMADDEEGMKEKKMKKEKKAKKEK